MTTKIITWDEKNGFRKNDLLEAKTIIEGGGLVAFPTETVYGLGGNGLLSEVAEKIYKAKGRPSDNPLILHISSKELLPLYVKTVSEVALRLIEAFWPGPLTLIFEKKDCVPYTTTGGLDTVAIRMPSHSGAREFLDLVEIPIAAPSANISGKPSPTEAKHVIDDLCGKVDMIIDGGEVGIGIESTIVDLTGDTPVVLRPGIISREDLERVVGEDKSDEMVCNKVCDGQESELKEPKAPGMKYRHYAPNAAMTVVDGDTEEVVAKINELVSKHSSAEVGILATEETRHRYTNGHVVCMGSREKRTLTRELYRAIRKVDRLGVTQIYAEGLSNESGAEALMNRLKKAAGYHIITLKERMSGYHKIIFVCKENLTQSPMAEWMFKSIAMDVEKEIYSRGLVVLFPEPVNPKVVDVLSLHGVPCEEHTSQPLKADDIDEHTLIITMNSIEKIKIAEEFGTAGNVFTINEYIGLEGELVDPYGGEEEDYENCYSELKKYLSLVKKKINWK